MAHVLEVDQREQAQPANAPATLVTSKQSLAVDALSLAEGGLLADVAVVLELARVFLPVVGVALAPLVPVPFALLMLRRGWRATLLAVMVATLLMGLITGLHYGWRMAASGLVGLLLGFAMRIRLRPVLVVVLGTVLTSLALYAFFFATLFALAIPVTDLIKEMQNSFQAVNSAGLWLAGQVGLASFWHDHFSAILALEAWMVHFWPLVAYLLLLCWSCAAVMLYYMVSNRLMRFLGFEVRPFPSPRFEQRVRRVLGLRRFVRFRRRRQQSLPT